ncbi:MAG: DNA methyltransferase [Anaerolineaceae bacterium]
MLAIAEKETSIMEKTLIEKEANNENSIIDDSTLDDQEKSELNDICAEEEILTKRFGCLLVVNKALDRKLVSFQANKKEVGYRWYKYKEGFSAALIRYIFENVGIKSGCVLDPFAGSGTTLFVASELGIDAVGIELLPSSVEIIETKQLLIECDRKLISKDIIVFLKSNIWEKHGEKKEFPHLKITDKAFPKETEEFLGRYLYEVEHLENQLLKRVLRFAVLCILEQISYTRKDGQYLRWDWRSGRSMGSKHFDKGKIPTFTEAIREKLYEIYDDLMGGGLIFDLFYLNGEKGKIEIKKGSCLDILPNMGKEVFDGLITSPPYCNRYDYTRTYALELAMLGVDEKGLKQLRQELMTCTVENRDKKDLDKKFSTNTFQKALEAWESQRLLQKIVRYLEESKRRGRLNNDGIPRMVKNYFFEMALIITEAANALKPGAPFVMVNDNVRYQGAHVPVDLILTDMAEKLGFRAEIIWVLPKGKGNSSQQMGKHGREELRKCVYVWRKIKD